MRFTVEKGEIVVREGNVVTALDLERLEALGLRNPSMDWPEILGRGMLALALVIILVYTSPSTTPRCGSASAAPCCSCFSSSSPWPSPKPRCRAGLG